MSPGDSVRLTHINKRLKNFFKKLQKLKPTCRCIEVAQPSPTAQWFCSALCLWGKTSACTRMAADLLEQETPFWNIQAHTYQTYLLFLFVVLYHHHQLMFCFYDNVFSYFTVTVNIICVGLQAVTVDLVCVGQSCADIFWNAGVTDLCFSMSHITGYREALITAFNKKQTKRESSWFRLHVQHVFNVCEHELVLIRTCMKQNVGVTDLSQEGSSL